MARANVAEIKKEEEMRNKDYVWKKPLVMKINKHRRTKDFEPAFTGDRRLNIERREFDYDEYIPERRGSKIDRRKLTNERRKN